MSLRFHYVLEPVNHPVLPLGGRWVGPRPTVCVALMGPTGTRALDALLDTGSDDTVFPESVASHLGIDLTNAPVGSGTGLGLVHIPLRYAEVTLRLTDGKEKREWKGWVGFTPTRLAFPVLGFAGCLQFFTATFYGDVEEVELTVNRLYPGT